MRARMVDVPLVAGALAIALCCAMPIRADLKAALAEPDLEKRSGLALDNAAEALKTARQAYDKDDKARFAALTEEMEQSVDLAQTSLQQTGKDPRNHPKWFKKAEIATRDLLRRLDALEQEMNYADRPLLEKVKAHVMKVHDELLLGLMEGKHK
jgi:uncharacterized protein with gpF-like domain